MQKAGASGARYADHPAATTSWRGAQRGGQGPSPAASSATCPLAGLAEALRRRDDPHPGRTDRRHRGAQGGVAGGDVGARSRAGRVRPALQGLCRDPARRRGGARIAAAARRDRGARRDARRSRAPTSAQMAAGRARRARGAAARGRARPRAEAAAARRRRRARRRCSKSAPAPAATRPALVRRRPAAHVPALCRRPGLAGRADLGQRRPRSAATRKRSPRSPGRACSRG